MLDHPKPLDSTCRVFRTKAVGQLIEPTKLGQKIQQLDWRLSSANVSINIRRCFHFVSLTKSVETMDPVS